MYAQTPENSAGKRLGTVSGHSGNPTWFPVHVWPGFDGRFGAASRVSENNCFPYPIASTGFALLPEKSGVWA
jgi:hypothetical protein